MLNYIEIKCLRQLISSVLIWLHDYQYDEYEARNIRAQPIYCMQILNRKDLIMLVDIIAKGFLTLSHDTVIIPIIVLGYIWADRKLFYHATCILLFNMLANVALKQTFQIPLASGVGHDYAFPSGHMQSAMTFYGWLAYKIHNTAFRIAALAVVLGIGFGLIYFGYHNIVDVVGAVVIAIGLIVLYSRLITLSPKTVMSVMIGTATILFVYIAFRATHMPKASLLAYYALLGFILSEKVFDKKLSSSKTVPMKRKILASLLCFSGIAIILYGFFELQQIYKGLPLYISELQWLAVGFMLPFSRSCRFKHRQTH